MKFYFTLSLALNQKSSRRWMADAATAGKVHESRETHYYKSLFHQFVHSPTNIQSSQVTVVLTYAQEYHGNASGVHHADERADHVAHCVALGDDEAVHADAVVAELALYVSSVTVVLDALSC